MSESDIVDALAQGSDVLTNIGILLVLTSSFGWMPSS